MTPSPRSLERAREFLIATLQHPGDGLQAEANAPRLALLIDAAVEEERAACLTIVQEAGMFGSELAAAKIAKRIHDYIAARGAANRSEG